MVQATRKSREVDHADRTSGQTAAFAEDIDVPIDIRVSLAANIISAFASQEKAAATIATAYEFFTSEKELTQLAVTWPQERLVPIYNGLPGAKPVKTFKTAKLGATNSRGAIQGLAEAAKPAYLSIGRRARSASLPTASCSEDGVDDHDVGLIYSRTDRHAWA